MKKDIKQLIKSSLLVFDGAMGTELQKRGLKGGALPERLNVTNPEELIDISTKYIKSGSDIISTNTFGANCRKIKDHNELKQIILAAVDIANKAANNEKYVALDIGPLGELLEPMGSLTFDEAYRAFREIVLIAKDNVDLVLIETMTDLYEVKAALLAVKENSDLPVIATMSFQEDLRTFTGCSVQAFALTASAYADAIGINCSLGPKQILPIMKELIKYTSLPTIIQANAGLPDSNMVYSISPEEFASTYEEYYKIGVNIFGGCCGTSFEYIRQIKNMLKGKTFFRRDYKKVSAVCSSSKVVEINGVKVIGERINPTGKKLMKKALLEGDYDFISDQALSQIEAGADILDVNAGLPEIDEKTVLTHMVRLIQSICVAPLQIDCGKVDAIEKALRYYNGKAIVNSVNGEDKSLDSILPVVKKYGAAVVGLTIDEEGIPKTVEKRVKIAEKIIKKAKEYGIDEEDVYIDCLTLTVSAEQNQALNTLKAISIIKSKYNVKTVLGVSNISFGLPNRVLINSAFLTMAMYAGLDLPILNPNIFENMQAVDSFRVLSNEDKNCVNYIDKYSNIEISNSHSNVISSNSVSSNEDIFYCIKKGINKAVNLTQELLQTNTPIQVIDEYLIPALNIVGDEYEKGKMFLPQLIMSADCAKLCFDEVKKLLPNADVSKGKIVLATVKGDVHDIGKNIVKTVLENYGYTVIDLGKNVEPELFVKTCIDHKVKLCGLSALMTTTVCNMEETIKQLKEQYSECKVMVGGAVLNQDYADKIGADYYAKDANCSVKIAASVFNNN